MTTYSCETCKFTTPLKSNYMSHHETRKHIKNSAEVSQAKTYDCKFCHKTYSHKQSLTKHLKTCTKKEEIDSIQEMKEQIKRCSLVLQEQRIQLIE